MGQTTEQVPHCMQVLNGSPLMVVTFSKNFMFYNNPAAWHGGINYSLENDNDNDPNLFVGFNADVGPNMTFLAEYDFGINDTERYHVYGQQKRGYLNMGLAGCGQLSESART